MKFDIKGKIINNLCLKIVLISSFIIGIIAMEVRYLINMPCMMKLLQL